MSELSELRASLARAQQELDVASTRIDALEASRGDPSATVLTPRAVDMQRRRLVAVGVLSSLGSLGTAVLLGLFMLVSAPSSKPVPQAIVAAPAPVAATPAAPALLTVAIPEPPPVPALPPVVANPIPATPAEPPRPPQRIARVPAEPPSRDRAESTEMGSLTIVCLPQKCDSVTDNGVALGPSHIFNRPVSAGAHRLVLHAPNGVTKQLRVDVHPDQLKEIRVAMGDVSDVF